MKATSAAVLIAMAFSLVLFGISYYYFTTRNRERMTILDKGLPADFFKDSFPYLPFVLLLGIVCIGIALGIVTGAFLLTLPIGPLDDFVFPFSIFLFLGISLVVSFFVLKSLQKKS